MRHQIRGCLDLILERMHSSPPYPPLPPPSASFPLAGISALILIYVVISYLIFDFVVQNEHNNRTYSDIEHGSSGLSPEDREAIPWFVFDYERNTTTSCVICLDCFEKGERCKSLPICKHTFHAHCIDLWLVRKLNCPTCRSPFTIKGRLEVV